MTQEQIKKIDWATHCLKSIYHGCHNAPSPCYGLYDNGELIENQYGQI